MLSLIKVRLQFIQTILVLYLFLSGLDLQGQELAPLPVRPVFLESNFDVMAYRPALIILPVDSITRKQKISGPFFPRAWNALKDNAPEITEKEGKYKLVIKLPWRKNDFNIPYPIGFTRQPNPPPYNPNVAYQRSAIFPGWGQAYNRSYWKIPIFYAGYGGFVWWVNYNNGLYRRFGTAYLLAIDDIEGNEDTQLSAIYDAEGLRTRRNEFRSRRDNAYLLLVAWHGVQVIEAYVNAHLRGFDVSEDLSFKAFPDVLQIQSGIGTAGMYPGLSLQLSW